MMDLIMYFGYILLNVFYIYPKRHDDSPFDSYEGYRTIFLSTFPMILVIGIIVTESTIYVVSVRPAQRRGIYQKFNYEERYW